MKHLKHFISLLLLFTSQQLLAGPTSYPSDSIYRSGETEISLTEALSSVRPGDVVLMGEQHGTLEQASQQMQIIETIKKNGYKVSVGMEFFTYLQQPIVDQWRKGLLTETDFLLQMGWGQGFMFDAYRRQVSSPGAEEFVIALNSPRSVTSQVAKGGLGSLDEAAQKLLPPDFSVGNPGYFERFKLAMGHAADPKSLENYFTAQCIWDDTMAWQTAEFMKLHPDQVLVIVVGEFHVQYGGGLPDRLRARGLKNITSFSLVNLYGLDEASQANSIRPSAEYGPRADFVWTSRILSQ